MADRLNTTTLSRRSTFGLIAGLGALGAAPVVLAAPAHPDAELFVLRDQLRAVIDRKRPVDQQVTARHARLVELFHQRGRTDEALTSAAGDSGFDEAVDEQAALCGEADAITKRMRAASPKTFAGIAAVAHAVKLWDARGDWDEPEDDRDWDRLCMCQFIDRLIELGSAAPAAA